MDEAVHRHLAVVVHQEEQVRLLEGCALSGPVDVWLKIDTGMHRLGFMPERAADIYRRLRAAGATGTIGLLTHFASADMPASPQTGQQITRFRAVQEMLARGAGDAVPDSLANSAAVLAWPAAHGAWVRPGIMLYGSSPFADRSAAELGLLKRYRKAAVAMYVAMGWVALVAVERR